MMAFSSHFLLGVLIDQFAERAQFDLIYHHQDLSVDSVSVIRQFLHVF